MHMPGRPERTFNTDLAKDFHAWRSKAGISVSAAVGYLRVAPSTLTRSLKISSFSFDLKLRVEDMIAKDPASHADMASKMRPALGALSEKDLHLLHEFVNLIPKADAILTSCLDLRAEGEKP